MNQEVKKKWVEAMRSGKYKQGVTYLRRGDCFSCLGVLCDISSIGEWDKRDRYLDKSQFLPDEVAEWAELPEESQAVLYQGAFISLMTLNDVVNLTFPELADLIDSQL